ncbi:MAG TPA: NAD(P)/FAD-dependent oxidoreductase [Solirubrobacteraceae bacterium]|nr:NAD(P)/FAD-dependent oxidoreductase [Solirubrobacteraceae bacterium]
MSTAAPVEDVRDEHATEAPLEHLDVLIIGAGLSGIGAAHHLQTKLPHKSYAILEARDTIGGTWDLFRYPGVRSDSDMHTLGYRFRPWTAAKAIADGPAILEYVSGTAREAGIDRRIRFGHRVTQLSWSSDEARWTVTAERTGTGETVRLTAGFVLSCSGYYRYDEGYSPHFPGTERFRGRIVHPQHWPEDLDYAGRRVVVIGSGATAVTLVPAMTDEAAHVTMLQRSPSYILAVPETDPAASALAKVLPKRLLYPVVRWKNVALATLVYRASRRWPRRVARLIRAGVRRRLPDGYDVDRHFRPTYDPWDQRMCLVPNGDLFEAISAGRASVVTDHIETFTERGIRLRSGEELEADVVVTATGLNLLPLGGVEFVVDGRTVELPETMAYKSMMLSGLPNYAFLLGYTNASWTLKADLTVEYVCRLLRHMDRRGYRIAVPERAADVEEEPFLDFQAGYVMRSLDQFPKQGSKAPWRVHQNYARDLVALRHGPVTDGMRFAA